jgi:hypothetical protein
MGNATPVHGHLSINGDTWTFLPDGNFPLAGSTFRRVDHGVYACTGQCSHGVKYFFETSYEDMRENARYRETVTHADRLCPAIFKAYKDDGGSLF